MSKLKTLADEKLNVVLRCCDEKKNTVGKAENAGYQHFLSFPQYFSRFFEAFNFLGIQSH